MKSVVARPHFITLALLVAFFIFGSPPNALANSIVNGDFATGDLTGWTASAIDASGNPVPPLIEVVDLGVVNSAVFSTGEFATAPFISTLEQSFTVDAAEPVLSVDFALPDVIPDPTGTGASDFSDSLIVSVQNGGPREVLLVIKDLAIPDPFGTAPGSVALGPSAFPVFDFNLKADLSSLIGSPVTLFIDVISEDDGFMSRFDPSEMRTEAPGSSKLPDSSPTLPYCCSGSSR